MIRTEEGRALFAQLAADRAAYVAARDEIYKFKKEGDVAQVDRAFSERFEPTKVAFQQSLAKVLELQRRELDEASGRIRAASTRATQLLTALCVGSLLLAALLAWRLTLSITRPLEEARQVADQIAAMDLTGRDQGRYAQDETGMLLRALAAMRSALQGSLHDIRNVADSIATAT